MYDSSIIKINDWFLSVGKRSFRPTHGGSISEDLHGQMNALCIEWDIESEKCDLES